MERRPPRRRSRVLLATLSIASAILLAEVGVRVFCMRDGLFLGRRALPPFGAITHPDQARWVGEWQRALAAGETPPGAGMFDPELGTTMRPSAISVDGSYSTNALAARGGREYALATPPGVLRLLTFGDSFTFCSEVPDDGTWQAALERTTENVEAINFGIGGHGVDQAWLRFQRLRPRFDGPVVVTIGMMLENIARHVNRYRPIYYPATRVTYAKPRFVLSPSGRLELVPLPFEDFRAYLDAVEDGSVVERLADHEYWSATVPFASSVLARLVSGYFAYRGRNHRRLWEDPEGEPFQVTIKLLEAFHADALRQGAQRAPVLLFPSPSDLPLVEVDRRASTSVHGWYWAGLHTALDTAGVPHLDLSIPLARHCRESGTAPTDLYVGGHLTADANRIVARALLDWLTAAIDDSGDCPAPRLRGKN